MSYRTLDHAKGQFELAVMWLLIGAFFVTMALMFIHPTGAILMFWLGLVILALAALIEVPVRLVQRATARRALKRHVCPRCDAEVVREAAEDGRWTCANCGAAFLDSGAEHPQSASAA